MKRLGIAFSMLVFVGFLFVHAAAAEKDSGGVLFYAGFEDSLDAQAAGDGKPVSTGKGKPVDLEDFTFADGFRGKALMSFNEATSPRYAAADNLYDEQGAIEMWVSPVKWTPNDGFFHAFFVGQGPGWLWIYKYISNTQLYFLLGEDRKTNKIAGGNVAGWKEGRWHQVVATWNAKQMALYLDGKRYSAVAEPKFRRGGTGLFVLGDGDLGKPRAEGVGSKIDEVYIYDRPLTAEEVAWTFQNAKTRKAGQDLPVDEFPQARKSPRPKAAKPQPKPAASAKPSAKAIDYKYERGGVLFYAGFDGTRDAQAKGDGKAKLIAGGGKLTADGFDSIRGSALESGDGAGYLEFSAESNVFPDEGTIEMWIKPENWTSDDKRQHVFFRADGQGKLRFYKRADTVNSFMVKGPDVKDPNHFDDKYKGMVQTGYACQQKKDKWRQYFLIWKKGKLLAYYRGGTRFNGVHRSQHYEVETPSPGKLERILIGDFGGGQTRDARSFIDEVYIYNRALTLEEAAWANIHATNREKGMDIPSNFAQPLIKVVPDPENKALVVEVDSGDRTGNFAGKARLEPAAGTAPAPIEVIKGRYGQARIPYEELPQGDYKVIAEVTTKDGKPIGTVTRDFVVPGPPVWLTEKVGVSDTPPPPWTPIEVEGSRLRVWGREYDLGAFGLPQEIVTHDQSILAGPISLRCVRKGKKVDWNVTEEDVVEQTEAAVTLEGTSTSTLGTMAWRVKAEYDGFLLYDLELTPAPGATCDLMELRVPIRKEFAVLHYKHTNDRGFISEEPGVFWKAGFGRYWWIGTDDFGLCGATEHAGANIDRADDAFSIVRKSNGNVDVVYRFVGKPMELKEPWKLRWILQATPTKPLPKDWRVWRDVSRHGKPSSRRGNLVVASPWPHEAKFSHFSFPVLKNPDWYRNYVNNWHEKGALVLPYSQLITMSPGMPECAFYWREWHNPSGTLQDAGSWPRYVSAKFVPSYIDFMAWKHRELAREYGHDGLYVDFAGVYGGFFAPEHGAGYVRDGKEYPAMFPICAVREMWKRVYTMFKERNPDSVIVGHDSSAVHAPVLSFCDVWLNGEHNWRGPLRDNYLEALPLDALRAAFRAQAHGGIPWWLPQWHGALLDDKDVASRFGADYVTVSMRGKPRQVTVEKSHHLLGIGLLLDIGFWPICGMNGEATFQVYAVQDDFGIADAEFFGYWDNADLIGGQTDAVKASAYRKPEGGALVVIYNTTRKPVDAKLRVAWDKLKGAGPLKVADVYTGQTIPTKGDALTLEVPPLNYRLVRVE